MCLAVDMSAGASVWSCIRESINQYSSIEVSGSPGEQQGSHEQLGTILMAAETRVF